MGSFANLQGVALGFDPHNVLLMDITLPESRYPTTAKKEVVSSKTLLSRLRHWPESERLACRPRCR